MSLFENARPTLDRPDDDPWLWLEEVEGKRALAWVEAANVRTLAMLDGPRLEADAAALRAELDRDDKLPWVVRRGAWLYNFWRDRGHPRGLLRRTTLDSYRAEQPSWEAMLDLDALAASESEDWVWGGSASLPGTHDRLLCRLSRGGGDAVVLREFDLAARAFVVDGFSLPEAKGGAVWLDRDTLLLSSAWGGEGMATRSGYARTVRLWRRGTDPSAAELLFAVDPEHMSAWGSVDRDDGERVVFLDRIGPFDVAVHLGTRLGPGLCLDLPADAEPRWERGWLAVRLRSPWIVGEVTHPADTLLGIALDAFLAGGRDFEVLRSPQPRRALQGFHWCAGHLLVSELDELRPVHAILTPSRGSWSERTVRGLPEWGVASIWPLDAVPEESDGSLLVQTENPVTPATLSLTGVDLRAPVLLRRDAPTFDARGLVVTRHEAVSSDGERIPYVQTGPAGEPTGEAPVLLTGYGGFRQPQLPYYHRGASGKLWLERGGTAVRASLRGGGEFGTAWHEAGRREGKRLSHDDFAAVAADLVRRGVTRPGRIAAEGASNGGLLVANMLTRYPRHFGALFCTIPLIDMRRYARLLAGASWVAEYGDPERPEDWAFLRHISAYHVAAPDRPYPPILVATTRRDDRVHPGHARKFAAKLQSMGYPTLFYESAAGGHGYGKDNAEAARFAALGFAFLRRAIGWEDGA